MSLAAVIGTDGAVRTDDGVRLEGLSGDEREVAAADEFVTYGKANIEQWDDPEPGEEAIYIEMDALEDSLDQLMALGNISRGHKDVRVGEPLEEYVVPEDTEIESDGRTLSLEGGDVLRAEVIREGEPLPGDNGTAGEDALWLPSRIYGAGDDEGSRLSVETRLEAWRGELDGHSVTVDKREVVPEDAGLRVTDVDFHAVTIGRDDQIKNPGSEFDVVHFELVPSDDRRGGIRREASPSEKVAMGILDKFLGESIDRLATEAIKTAVEEEKSVGDAVQEVSHEGVDTGAVRQRAESRVFDVGSRVSQEAGDKDQIAADIADEFGVPEEEAMDIVEEIAAMYDDVADGGGDDEPSGDEGDEGGDGGSGGEPDEEPPGEPEQELDEDDVRGIAEDVVQEAVSELEENLADELVETVSQEMATGATSSGAGFATTGQTDIEAQAREWADVEDGE